MSVAITISKALDGSAVNDSLAGGGTGVDGGPVVSGSYGPVVNPTTNTGKLDIYAAHDGTNEITDFKVHIQQFGLGTGFTYGGADSAVNDITNLLNFGDSSGSSKNNADSLSGGLWMEMDADVASINQFDHASRSAFVKIFGDNGGYASGDGRDLASAFLVVGDAMVYESGGETLASAAVDGEIGPAGNTVLGDAAHMAYRLYVPGSHTDGGILQHEVVYSYAFTE